MATAFVLFLYLWTPSIHAGAAVTTAEFSTEDRCKAAGKAAADKFGGWYSTPYWLCIPK